MLAGRADMCALARPHLYDPHWTLHAAAEQEYAGDGVEWVPQYQAGSRKPPTGRIDDVRKELERSFEPDPPELLDRPRGLVVGDRAAAGARQTTHTPLAWRARGVSGQHGGSNCAHTVVRRGVCAD